MQNFMSLPSWSIGRLQYHRPQYRRPCSDFMDMLRRLISCRIIIIILLLNCLSSWFGIHGTALN